MRALLHPIRTLRACNLLFVLFLPFLSTSVSFAQTSEQPIADIYHTGWTTRDGAPRGVTSLAQTRNGYLWIGTILGLYRFDGSQFSQYPDPAGSFSLPSNNITALAADGKDGIWVGYDHRGLSHLFRGEIVNVDLPSPFESSSVDGIFCCARGSVWVLAGDTILRWHNASWENFAQSHDLPRAIYFSLFFDTRGNIWTSSRHGIYELQAGGAKFAQVLQNVFSVTQFAETRDGTLWISDGWRNARPLTSRCSHLSVPLRGTAALLFDTTGKLWIGTDGHGVERVNLTGAPCRFPSAPEPFTASNGLTSNVTHVLLQDRFGNVWVGTDMGIDRFRIRRFLAFGDQEFKFYPALVTAPDGSVWIEEQGRSLIHVSRSGVLKVGSVHDVSPLASDSESGVWFLDSWTHHLIHYSRENRRDRIVNPPSGLQDTAAQSIVSRPDGSLLVAFEGNGLWSYSKKWSLLSTLPQKTPTVLMQDGNTTWIGYFNNLVFELDGSHLQRYDSGDGIDLDTPLVVTRHDSTLWLGGTAGVDFMKTGHFHTLHVRAPERFRGVSGLVYDNQGNLWLNTGFGAMQIPATEVSKALNNPEYRVITKVYGTTDGVIGIPAQTRPVPSLIKDGDGRLWFATAGNLVTLSPEVLTSPRPEPILDLQAVRINGKQTVVPDQEGDPLVLDGGRENRIEFEFTAVDLDHPNHIIYRYRLAGEDKNWQMAGRNHIATYYRLHPGTYRFQVAATNGEDHWVELTSPFVFRIRPTFYQTTWFMVACWIIGLLCFWLLYLARVRYVSARLRDRIEQRSNERLRIARELHDTLLQSIHGLMLRFHYAADSLRQDDPSRPALEAALKRADALILEGRNSVQDLRGEADKARRLSEMLAEAVKDVPLGDAPTVQIIEEGIAYPLRPMVQEEFCKIGREAIHNALHHAKAANVRVEVRYGRQFFWLICRDDGIGIPDEIVQVLGGNGHWGLKGMQERARSIGATLNIWTSEGNGTEVEVRLCGSAAYNNLSSVWSRLFARTQKAY